MHKSRVINGIVKNKEAKGKRILAKKFRKTNQKSIIGEGENQWYFISPLNAAIKSKALLIIEYNLNKWCRTRADRILETKSKLMAKSVLWERASFTKMRIMIISWFIRPMKRSLCLKTNRTKKTHPEERGSIEMWSKDFFI